jgi:hypothetical protein
VLPVWRVVEFIVLFYALMTLRSTEVKKCYELRSTGYSDTNSVRVK